MRKLLVILALSSSTCFGAPKILLYSDSESELKNKIVPPSGVVNLIVRSEPDDVDLLNQCLVDSGLGSAALSTLFVASVIDLNKDGLPDYFVRPALEPYCHAFYGAHLFRYWFITSHQKNEKIFYKIAFKNGGDEVKVLSSTTNGYQDLVLVDHNAVESYTSTLRFSGIEYKTTNCVKEKFQPDGRTRMTKC